MLKLTLLYKETRPILSEHPAISTIHVIDRTWKKQGIRHQLKQEFLLLKAVRSRHYDLVVNLADQWRSSLLSMLSGAKVRLGFDYKKRRSFIWRAGHTDLVTTENHGKLHTVEQNMSILTALDFLSKMPKRRCIIQKVTKHFASSFAGNKSGEWRIHCDSANLPLDFQMLG